MAAIPEAERDNLVLAYNKRLTGPSGEERDKGEVHPCSRTVFFLLD